MSIDTDAGFWKWVAGSILTAGGAVWGFFKYIDSRLDKKADKHQVKSDLQTVTNEIATVRTNQAKVFDQIRENEQRANDRDERFRTHVDEKFDRLTDLIQTRMR